MKTMRLFPLELKRLLQSRLTWLMMALTVLSPVLGLVLYKPATSTTMLSMYLANPAIAGGVGGAILFGLLTIFELDRACRSRVDILTDAVVSPLTTALTRLLALLTAAVLTVGLTMLVWLPISAGLIGSVFTGANYVLAYLLLMGLALPLGVLAAAAAYQFTRRADLSIVLFIAFCALSLTVWASDWQLCWLNPCVWALSDDFSNFRVFRSVAWMRFTWLLTLAGVWTVSYLCIRQYGKGVFGSLARSTRRLYRPVIALALLACSGTAYAAQPFIDRSNPDLTVMSFYEIPYAEGVTFVRRTAQVFPDTDAGTVTGRASYQFQNTSGQEQSVSFGINPGYTISNVKANGADVPFTVSDYQEYQRGPAGSHHSRRGGGGADHGVQRIPPGEPAHHAGRQGAEPGIPLPGELGPLAPCDECHARRGWLSHRNRNHPAGFHARHSLRVQRSGGRRGTRRRHQNMAV